MVKIKICGIKNEEEALMVVKSGAEAVGFIFAESRRRITPEKAREICGHLPPFISKVGIFVNEDPWTIKIIADECGLDVIQFHGQEDPSSLLGFRQKIIKSFAVKNEESLQKMEEYKLSADAWLLDTYVSGTAGGTGITFNWSLVKKIIRDKPIILAGGLNEKNVIQALEAVRPYGVDVCSGVETEGKKDYQKIIKFTAKVRSWNKIVS